MSTPNGVAIGGTGQFSAAFLQSAGGPAGTLQAGAIPQWSLQTADANITITPSADGTQASVAVGAGETASTFTLVVNAINSDGKAISGDLAVPVLPAVPPDMAAQVVVITQTA